MSTPPKETDYLLQEEFQSTSMKKGLTQKGHSYMSTSAFQTMAEEVAKQQRSIKSSKVSRSKSVDRDISSGVDQINQIGRRALYGTLPFIASFGMQHRENKVKRVLSLVSQKSMDNITKETEVIYY